MERINEKIELIIKDVNWKIIEQQLKINLLNNNEIFLYLTNLEKENWSSFKQLFNSNIEIKFRFNFDKINQEVLLLFFIINSLNKYKPKSIQLVLPFIPYTRNELKDFSEIPEEDRANYCAFNSSDAFLKLLETSWVTSILTYDLINKWFWTTNNLFIKNVEKNNIFIEDFEFLDRTEKNFILLALNEEDYNLLYRLYSKKTNFIIINCSWYINFKSWTEVSKKFLKTIKDYSNYNVFIFDKEIGTGFRLISILKHIVNYVPEVREISVFATHWIFSKWNYKKFNNLFEHYPKSNILIYTTNSINWYSSYINKENIKIINTNELIEDNNDISLI